MKKNPLISRIVLSLLIMSGFGLLADDGAKAAAGLKDALKVGVKNAIAKVGIEDGYYKNLDIKILLPDKLKKAEKYLDKIGAEKLTESLIKQMNRAAESAAPGALDIFGQSIKNIEFGDAVEILKGEDDAATRYLQTETTQHLIELFHPIVKDHMEQLGVIKLFNEFCEKYQTNPLLKKVDLDISQYATEKAVDGLFKIVAEEEAKIRDDPAARVTDLLKDVFGGMFGD